MKDGHLIHDLRTKCSVTIDARVIQLSKREDDKRYGFTVQHLPLQRFLSPHCISKIVPDSKADKAGMKEGDFILEINEEDATMQSHECLTSRLEKQRDAVTLLVFNCPLFSSSWSQLRTITTRNLVATPSESDLVLEVYKEMYNNHAHADFIIESCEGRKFAVHRAILAARSKVFAAMLEHNTEEKQTGRCVISDVEGEPLDAVLEYLYCNSVERVLPIAEKCLIVADKYCMDDLKSVCEKQLLATITVANSAKLLILAQQYYLVDLETRVDTFVRENLHRFGCSRSSTTPSRTQ